MKKRKGFKIIVMLNLFDKGNSGAFGETCDPVCRAQHLMFKRFRNKFGMTFGRAFTLAEVLITLVIIGVIAALTIPNLMKKWEDQHTVSAVKEASNILNTAVKMMTLQEGLPDAWIDWPSTDGAYQSNYSTHYLNKLIPFLKVAKSCNSFSACMPTSGYKYFKGGQLNDQHGYYGAKSIYLQNEMQVTVSLSEFRPTDTFYNSAKYNEYHHIGTIMIDINGKKGPNRYGYDVFFFKLGDNGLLYGKTHWVYQQIDISRNCSLYLTSDYTSADGVSCSTWIIKHGNVDYKYRDVSAEW